MEDFDDNPQNVLDFVFPEAKESEDEKIRKEIVHFIKGIVISNVTEEQRYMWLAWLEKQGEKKSVEINDEWIEKYWQHEKVNNPDSYNNGDEIQFDHDGFVRFCKMYCQKHYEQKPNFCHHEVDFSNCSEEYRKAYYDGWNNCNQQHEQMKNLQKPTWSEEDEEMLDRLTEYFELGIGCFFDENECNEAQDWLKSLKDRITITNKNDFDKGYEVGISAAKFNQWKPTEEQMEALCDLIYSNELKSLYEDLKKL